MTEWQYFPKSSPLPAHLQDFLEAIEPGFITVRNSEGNLKSNEVLEELRPHMESIGYQVEKSTPPKIRVKRPVLFGQNGLIDKSFEVDAFHTPTGTVVEIEAGRGVRNYQFLKDFFECLCIQDAEYLVIGVLNEYKPPSTKGQRGHKDFEDVVTFFDSLFASQRFDIPLKGLLIIGYDNT